MRSIPPIRGVRGVAWACVLVLAALSSARADDDAVQTQLRYAREQILRRAGESVDPAHPGVGGLEGLRTWLAEHSERFLADRDTAPLLKAAQELLGAEDTREGLVRQAAVLYRWVSGETDNAETERPPLLRLLSSAEPPVVTRWPAEALAQAHADAAAQATAGEGATRKPAFAFLPKEIQTHILEDRLDVDRRAADGTIELYRQVGECGEEPADLEKLRGYARAAARKAQGAPGSAPGSGALTAVDVLLTRPDELELGICRAWALAREEQVAPRVQLYQSDNPPAGLVSEGTVRTKQRRAQAFRDQAEALATSRAATEAALDRMVRDERRLTEDAGRLGFEIEEARRDLETLLERVRVHEEREAARQKAEADPGAAGAPKDDAPKDDDPPPGDDEVAAARYKLEKLELREIVGEQYLRLLYIAVRRAEGRLILYAAAIHQTQAEEVEARAAAQRYEVEINRMRRERQLDRLLFEEARLVRDQEEAHAKAESAPEVDRPLWAAYDRALAARIVVNRSTREAVGQRRELERRAKPPRTGSPASPSTATPRDGDPIARWRDPRAALVDAKDAADATAALDQSAWTGELIAQHYDVVRARVEGLRGALGALQGVEELRRSHGAALAAARTALEDLGQALARRAGTPSTRATFRYHAQLTRKELENDVSAFEETLKGMADVRRRISEDIELFEAYRRRLLGQGSLSFRIRVRRTLDAERLGDAWRDTQELAGDTGRWITLQGDAHAGTFLERQGTALLAGLAVLLASIAVVRFGRRGLDRILRAMATRVPELRAEPVTVRAEEAQKKREKAVQEAAAKAAEAEALREVSSEEAARPQRMGEGGYGGEDA